MVTSPTTSTVFHPKFLKLLTRFHKKSTHRNLLRTPIYKTQEKQPQKSSHAPPKSFDTPRHNPSNLWEPVQNFAKLTLQGSSTALDLQYLKITGPDAQPRASTRLQKVRRPSASLPLTRFHTLDAPSADTCPLRMTSWMTSSYTTRFD